MKARRSITILFCLITAIANAKIINDSLYEIPKTKIPPVIDGIQDAVWKTLDWNMQRIYNVGDPPTPYGAADSGAGLTGMHKAMWDSENLYILFYSIDDKIVDIPSNPGWSQDAIEIYIDQTYSRKCDCCEGPCPGIGGPPFSQFIIPHKFKGVEDSNLIYIGGNWQSSPEGIKFRIRDVDNSDGMPGWMLEIKIPLAHLELDADTLIDHFIGWELQQDECDDSTAGRQSMSKWWNASNLSWTDAGLWGTAVFSNREVDSVLEINKRPTSDSIIIDGEMDPVYKLANPISLNVFRVDSLGSVNDVISDGFLTAYPLWDENYLYLFLDVVDDKIVEIPANPIWAQDGISIYLDPDNSKIPDGVGPDPGAGFPPDDLQLTIPYYSKGMEACFYRDSCFFTIFVFWPREQFSEYKIADKEGGYNVEIKLFNSVLGIGKNGNKIGLEIQLDDYDSTSDNYLESMQKWWHSSNLSWTDASIWGTAQLSGLIVNVKEDPVANYFNLAQNYPNPFNPSTTFSFSVPVKSHVSLRVYDLIGREVATVVSEELAAGNYTRQWNASALSSGVYFYRIQARNFVETKKLMLLK